MRTRSGTEIWTATAVRMARTRRFMALNGYDCLWQKLMGSKRRVRLFISATNSTAQMENFLVFLSVKSVSARCESSVSHFLPAWCWVQTKGCSSGSPSWSDGLQIFPSITGVPTLLFSSFSRQSHLTFACKSLSWSKWVFRHYFKAISWAPLRHETIHV